MKLSIPTYILSKTMQYCAKIHTETPDIQLKERIDIKRGIEGMFSADNFDFYSNFWNIGETIGLS